MTATRKRVYRIFHNETDLDVLILGLLGYSTSLIERKTGLTPGKISYRLRKGGVSRMEYRNGESIVAKRAMAAGTRVAKLEAKARAAKYITPANAGGLKD